MTLSFLPSGYSDKQRELEMACANSAVSHILFIHDL